MIAALQDADDRARMKREITPSRLDNNWLTNFTRPENQIYDGRLITDIAEMRGQDPADSLFDLLLSENLGISTVGLGTNAQTLYAFVSHPYGMIASDAILFGEYPNPRTYGCFPIVLAEFVRAEKHLRLPEAIRKMTSFPAQRLGIPDRGLLRDGFKADIVVFNPDTVKALGYQGEPQAVPGGHRVRHRQRPGGDPAGRKHWRVGGPRAAAGSGDDLTHTDARFGLPRLSLLSPVRCAAGHQGPGRIAPAILRSRAGSCTFATRRWGSPWWCWTMRAGCCWGGGPPAAT